jgi:hypothetical protein
VKVAAGEEFGLASGEPLLHLAAVAFGARPITAAVTNPKVVAAILAAIAMSAHFGCHAAGDVVERLLVGRQHHMTELRSIGVAEPADHVRQFQFVVLHGKASVYMRSLKNSPSIRRRSCRRGSVKWV